MSKKKTTTSKGPDYQEVSFSELTALCNEPLKVEVVMRGKPVRFVGRRLTAEESRPVRALLLQALPPELPPTEPGGETRFDLRNPAYLEEKEGNRRMARALAIYTAFPSIRAGRPDLVDRQEIVKFVEMLDDDLLETLWTALSKSEVLGEVEQWKKLGFI